MAPTNLSERLKAFADRFAALGRPAQGPGGGYTGLSDGGAGGLGAPLVGGGGGGSTGVGGEGRYYHQQQQAPSRYNPPQTTTTSQQYQQPHYGSVDAAGVGDAGAGAAVNLPTQAEDLAELTALSSEASSILWEFAAMGERSPAAAEIAEKARSLQAQLRGLISDFSGGGSGSDERGLAAALEAFEMLTTTLDEYDGKVGGAEAVGAGASTEATTTSNGGGSAVAPAAAAANPFNDQQQPAAAQQQQRPSTAPGNRPDPNSDAPLISFD